MGSGARRRIYFGKLGVKRRRKRQSTRATETPCGMPERPLRRDMNGFRLEFIKDTTHAGLRTDREADLRIGRTGHRAKFQRRDTTNRVSQFAQIRGRRLQGSHHTVNLRLPSVGDASDPHVGPHDPLVAGSSDTAMHLMAPPQTKAPSRPAAILCIVVLPGLPGRAWGPNIAALLMRSSWLGGVRLRERARHLCCGPRGMPA